MCSCRRADTERCKDEKIFETLQLSAGHAGAPELRFAEGDRLAQHKLLIDLACDELAKGDPREDCVQIVSNWNLEDVLPYVAEKFGWVGPDALLQAKLWCKTWLSPQTRSAGSMCSAWGRPITPMLA